MRKLTSILIGGLLLAWMAYLSWPATADLPLRNPQFDAPRVPVKLEHSRPEAPSYEVFQPNKAKFSQPTV